MKKLAFTFSLISLILVGCTSFRGGTVERVKEFPAYMHNEKKTVSMNSFNLKPDMDAEMLSRKQSIADHFAKKGVEINGTELCQKELFESGMFNMATIYQSDPDIFVNTMSTIGYRSSSGWETARVLLSGMTLGIIPFIYTENFGITAWVRNSHNSGKNGMTTIEMNEKITNIRWLFGVFTTPNNSALTKEIYSDMCNNIALKIDQFARQPKTKE